MKQGWTIIRLGDVLEVQNGFAFDSKFFSTELGVPLIRIRDIKYGNKTEVNYRGEYDERFIVNRGDLLIGMDGEFNCYEWKGPKALLNQRVCRLQNFSTSIFPKFLLYGLNKYLKEIEAVTSYATVKHLSSKQIRNIEFPFPTLAEQKRIVAKLDQAFTAIDNVEVNIEKNLQNTQELLASYLNTLINGRNGDWVEECLEEIVANHCTLSYGIVQPGLDFPNGLPVVRPTDLTTKYVEISGLKTIDPRLAKGYQRTKLSGDDILLCVRGTTGTLSIACKDLKGANVTRGIVPINFEPTRVHQQFGYYALLSKYVQDQIKNKTYGTALLQINISDLRKLKIPYPKSITHQTSIKNSLEAVTSITDKLKHAYKFKLDSLHQLRKTVLEQAFTK